MVWTGKAQGDTTIKTRQTNNRVGGNTFFRAFSSGGVFALTRLLIACVKDRPVRASPDTLLASSAFRGLIDMSMFMDRQINFANNIVGTRLNAHPAHTLHRLVLNRMYFVRSWRGIGKWGFISAPMNRFF